jgi:protein-S-isoprenylcysteine O-methyltransferase Ste14/uncharacterized membrane protein (UPF0127 family)
VLVARNAANGAVLADRLQPARSRWTRLRGLLGTERLAVGEGLWIEPCRQVHMIGMRYALDVVFLDRGRRIVRIVRGLAPWRISPRVANATSALELPAGTADRLSLHEGAVVAIDGDPRPPTDGLAHRLAAKLGNVLLAAVFAAFAAVHVEAGRRTGQWVTIVPIVAQETLLVVLFLLRRRSLASSRHLVDWLVGTTGTLLPFALRPTPGISPMHVAGQPLQVGGLLLAIAAIVSLGRSIGVVAANRGIRTAGLYATVRHPMYAAHTLQYLGYLLSYPSIRNVLVVAVTVSALAVRAIREEAFLRDDPSYRAYLRRTRWRFLPGLY